MNKLDNPAVCYQCNNCGATGIVRDWTTCHRCGEATDWKVWQVDDRDVLIEFLKDEIKRGMMPLLIKSVTAQQLGSWSADFGIPAKPSLSLLAQKAVEGRRSYAN